MPDARPKRESKPVERLTIKKTEPKKRAKSAGGAKKTISKKGGKKEKKAKKVRCRFLVVAPVCASLRSHLFFIFICRPARRSPSSDTVSLSWTFCPKPI
jgi:hypothetical protein